jgi:hypothetical protein
VRVGISLTGWGLRGSGPLLWSSLYSLNRREGVFSESALPVFSVLGNSEGIRRAGV